MCTTHQCDTQKIQEDCEKDAEPRADHSIR